MTWCRRLVFLSVLCFVALQQASFAAPVMPTTPLSPIPEDTFLTVQLHGIERTLERFEALLQAISPELLKQMKPTLKELREGLEGRQWKGLAREGPHFLVLFEVPDFSSAEMPKFALLLRTTKYSDFRDGFLKDNEVKALKQAQGYEYTQTDAGPIYLVPGKEYTVLTERKDVAERFTAKFKGLDTRISATQSKRLLESDLGVYVAFDALGKDYAEIVKASRRLLDDVVHEIDRVIDLKGNATADLIRKCIPALFQAVDDSQGMLLTVDFKPTGLALHFATELRKASPTSRALKEQRVGSCVELGALPDGLMAYTAWQTSKPLLELAGPWFVGVLEKKERKQTEALTQLLKAEPMVRVEGCDPLLQSVQSWSCADPAAAVSAHLTILETLATGESFHTVPVRKRVAVSRDAQKAGPLSLHHYRIGYDLERAVGMGAGVAGLNDAQSTEVVRALKKQLGEDGNYWIGSDGKRLLQVSGKEWSTAEKLLERHVKGLAPLDKQATYQAVRKELPAEATLLLLVDLPRYVDLVYEVLKPIFQGELPRKPLARADRRQPAYMGLTLALQGERVGFDLLLTTEAARELVQRYLWPLIAPQ